VRDECLHLGQAWLRRERRGLVPVLTQHPDQPAHLGQRLAAGLFDGQERIALSVLGGRQQSSHRRRLHGHDTHAVGDHVVQLARDAGPLLGDGLPRVALSRLFQLRRPFFGCFGSRRAGAPGETGQPHDREQTGEHIVTRSVVGAVDDDDRDGHQDDHQAEAGPGPVGQVAEQVGRGHSRDVHGDRKDDQPTVDERQHGGDQPTAIATELR
jgi:hypothetical protein